MTIKMKIYLFGAVTFILFVVLALMNVRTHQEVLSNMKTRDQLNEKLAEMEKYAKWKNELISLISDMVASGHVPPFASEQLRMPLAGPRLEGAALVKSGKVLVSTIAEKESAVRDIEKTMGEMRVKINELYYLLDKKIATILAVAQMDQVLGKEASERNSLAPYVLKSLNQLTLVALNGLISKHFSDEEKGVVASNRRLLSSQLYTIDSDGSISENFNHLFALIKSIDAFVLESNRTLADFDQRIAAATKSFYKAAEGSGVDKIVAGAQAEVKRANETLETASRRTLITVIIFLVIVPVLVIVLGIFSLNTLIISPITSLVEAMKDVESGRFDSTAPIKTRDEIGKLSRAFNAMATEIETKVTELSMLNKTLAESESKYRTLVDNLPQKIFLKDKYQFYVSCNRNFAQDVGVKADEVKNKTDFDFFPQNLAEKYRNDDRRIINTEATEEIEESYILNGTEIIIQTVKTPIRDESGNVSGVLGIFWDITERKRAEEELHLAKFSLENASVGMYWIDSTGHIQYVNEWACSMLGYDRDELLALSLREIDSEFTDERYARFWREMTGGEPFQFESIQRRKDGSEFPVEIFGRLSEYKGNRLNFSFVSDISDRKQAEREMLESKELHQSIIQTAMDGFWLLDLQGRLLEVNEAYCRMSGYSEEELLKKSVKDLDAQESKYEIASRLKHAAQKTEERFETRHRSKDGNLFDLEINAQYRSEEGGRLVCFLRDVTDRKKLEAQLVQAHKMEAIGTLAGGISHDFNNLLQAINGYTQIVLLKTKEDDPDYANLQAIQAAGERAAELVKQLLLFSRKAESERRPINLNFEMERARGMLERTIPKMIDIRLSTGGRLWSVNADPVQMEQIILNLGKNAADAMPDGGTLTIETENITLDEEYATKHIDAEPGRYVLVTVSDTGHGMSRETIKHIFEPFYTTKGIGQGTGLGLASAYGIVKSHGGSITCYSEIGQGTVFKIYLPAVEQADEQAETMPEVIEPQGGTETILVVDDEELIRDFASQILEEFGYRTLTASCGEEALKIYNTYGSEIDMVILDIGMPGIGGHKCLQELLKLDPEIKVLIASGYAVNGQVQKSLDIGASGYVSKPYRVHNLMVEIRKVLDAT